MSHILKINARHLLALALFALLFFGMMVVIAKPSMVLRFANPAPANIPSPGHSSAEIVVNVDEVGAIPGTCSGDISLQEAIDRGCFGAGAGSGTGVYHPLSYGEYITLWDAWPGWSGEIDLSGQLPDGVKFVKLKIISRVAADGDTTGYLVLKSSNGVEEKEIWKHYDRVGSEWHANAVTGYIQAELTDDQRFIYDHTGSMNVTPTWYSLELVGWWELS